MFWVCKRVLGTQKGYSHSCVGRDSEPREVVSLGSHHTPCRHPRAPPPQPHSRFCVDRGRYDVVNDKKHSLPMSQSSKPGTWPWRLAQKSGSWSLGSTLKDRGRQAAGCERRRLACLSAWKVLPQTPPAIEWVGAVRCGAPLQSLPLPASGSTLRSPARSPARNH